MLTSRKIIHREFARRHALPASRFAVTARGRRAGITLTEVLISIFVLGAGLLGLASLVPLGQFHATQANHQDRAAACARWAFRQLEGQSQSAQNGTLNYLSARAWVMRNGAPIYGFAPDTRAMIIDPRFIAAENDKTTPAAFPSAPDTFPYAASAPNWTLLRATFAEPSGPAFGGALRSVLANDLCIWRDDILFTAANDNDRPGFVLSGTSNSNIASNGDYSWLAMIRPSEQETLLARRTSPILTQMIVSVVVLHDRAAVIDIAERAPSERQVQARQLGPGWFELQDRSPAPIGRIVPNQWVLISALQLPPNDPTPAGPLWFHRWYKVVNVTDTNPAGNRSIKVSGPDWPDALVDNSTIVCTIIDGAVGVYERPMTFNETFNNSTN
ncbi:MAG: hypothetical protein MPJ50_11355 [Pirellulales bacterium]|nr:hypothetical protein [Pirellulales bacterium]